MEIRVNVPEELAARAHARGVRLEVYVEELLAQQAAGAAAGVKRFGNTGADSRMA